MCGAGSSRFMSRGWTKADCRRALARPEQVPRSFESRHLHLGPLARVPLIHVHPEAHELPGLATWRQDLDPVLLVAKRARHGSRRGVVDERTAHRPPGVQVVKREPEDRRAHLLANTPPLELAPEPRTG